MIFATIACVVLIGMLCMLASILRSIMSKVSSAFDFRRPVFYDATAKRAFHARHNLTVEQHTRARKQLIEPIKISYISC
jgi:hypothetical protein